MNVIEMYVSLFSLTNPVSTLFAQRVKHNDRSHIIAHVAVTVRQSSISESAMPLLALLGKMLVIESMDLDGDDGREQDQARIQLRPKNVS